ncbi:MAG: methyltransferase domain-containing protein [Thermoplasmata archaeon]|nr:methyltransferase domain-containing protein [Thermoplasmata archaeon]
MRYLFEILGDNEALGKAEIIAVMDANGEGFNVLEDDDGILAVETGLSSDVFEKRLGLTRRICEHLVSGEFGAVEDFFRDYDLKAESFSVRAKRVKNHQQDVSTFDLQGIIGAALSKRSKVELEDPMVEVRIYVSGKCHAATKVAEIDRSAFENRKVRYRPFFSPISLHPKLARALVNISRVKEGEVVLDPFCGTGGILMEVGYIGANIVGSDANASMVKGCEENLHSMGLEGTFFKADVSDIKDHIESVDAIVTDPPYGRAASTKGEDISSLYERSFECFKGVLKRGGHLAIILPKKEHVELCSRYLKLKESYDVRVHKSLTRTFTVFENR